MIPQNLHEGLKRSLAQVVAKRLTLHDIDVTAWSSTFGNCGTEHVRAMFEHEQTKFSRQPRNNGEVPE